MDESGIGRWAVATMEEQRATIKRQADLIKHLRRVVMDLCPRVTVEDMADLMGIETDLERSKALREKIRAKHNIGDKSHG